mmetsp:Transcript_47237/g.109281  ORF Transcript_47237/g.109281 Transcript_47237/m.109281 type:complete len:224 (-) Transcript_47237:613-1284(-)
MLRASVACFRASRFSFMARLLLLCVTKIMAMSSCIPCSLRMVKAACAAWLHLPYCSSARCMLAIVWSMPASHLLSSGERSLMSRMNERPFSAMRRASGWSSFARFTATNASQAAASPFLSFLLWKRPILSFTKRCAAPRSPSARNALTTVPNATPSQPLSSPNSAKMFMAASAASSASCGLRLEMCQAPMQFCSKASILLKPSSRQISSASVPYLTASWKFCK